MLGALSSAWKFHARNVGNHGGDLLRVQWMDLSRNPIGDAGVVKLAGAIAAGAVRLSPHFGHLWKLDGRILTHGLLAQFRSICGIGAELGVALISKPGVWSGGRVRVGKGAWGHG